MVQEMIDGILNVDEKQNLTTRDHTLFILVQTSFILDNISLFRPNEIHTFRHHANSFTARIARANKPWEAWFLYVSIELAPKTLQHLASPGI